MARNVTLKQVAAQAGVSYQTVSKVINKQIQISPETEDRIWEAVRVLGYRPNQIARNMRAQRTRMIGYTWAPSPPDHSNPILDQFLQSMAQAAAHSGYHLLCFPHLSGQELTAYYGELIDTSRVDGFVLSAVEFDDPRIDFLQERHFPFVAFGRSSPEKTFPFIDVDGAAGIRMATEHLLALGHRRIAALAWPEGSRVGQNRLEGYFTTLQAAGVQASPEWIARGEGRFRFGREATLCWLDWPADRRPTAIVALNDSMAVGAMNAIQERNLRVGTDIAVTGFDDAPLVQYLTPPLTSVRQPIWQVGQLVVSSLVSIMEGKSNPDIHILLSPELIVRASSGFFTPAHPI